MSVFGKRMKEARTAAGLSQEMLGVLAGIDEMSSSARMNQYERGKHQPDFSMVERIAAVLNVPESYLYCKDEELAAILVDVHRLAPTEKAQVILEIRAVLKHQISKTFPN
jgi:transcriptional regulator with XRE-family HTH domain